MSKTDEEWATELGFESAEAMFAHQEKMDRDVFGTYEPYFVGAPQGKAPCKRCAGEAEWSRDGREVKLKCKCGWGAFMAICLPTIN